jgi:hypothetical protein
MQERLVIHSDSTLEIVPALVDELVAVAPRRDEQVDRALAGFELMSLRSPEDAYAALVAVATTLNGLAPAGWFFGPSPDDAHAFGWWELRAYTANKRKKRQLTDAELEAKETEISQALDQVAELAKAGALFIHNNSGGKDSQAQLIQMIEVVGIPTEQIISVHADLGFVEWENVQEKRDTKDIARDIAEHYGIEFFIVQHTRDIPLPERFVERVATHVATGRYAEKDEGYELEASPFPSGPQRYCTSEFKTSPCRILATDVIRDRDLGRALPGATFDAVRDGIAMQTKWVAKDMGKLRRAEAAKLLPDGTFVVHCLGLRAAESDDRGKRDVMALTELSPRSTKAGGRPLFVWDWLPIQMLSHEDVFMMIRAANQEPHWIYGEKLGDDDKQFPGHKMERASCSFCIYSSPGDLALAAKLRPDLYAMYVALERQYGKSFSMDRRFLEDMTGIQADEATVRAGERAQATAPHWLP